MDGTTIEVSQHNPPLEDIAQALTDSLPRDGSAPMTGVLRMGANKITGLAAGTAAGDALRFEQLGAFLSSASALSMAANEYIYASGVNIAAKGTITADARSLLASANFAAMLTALGGQPLDADLTALAGLATVGAVVRTGAGTASAISGAVGTVLTGQGAGVAPVFAALGSIPFATFNVNGTTTANLTGTYSRTGSTVTVTVTGHGHIVGHVGRFTPTTGAATAENFTVVSVIDANNFTFTHTVSGATSGNVTLDRSTIRKSSGVQSVAKLATGTYRVNFSAAQADANFVPVGNSNFSTTGLGIDRSSAVTVFRDLTTTGYAILTLGISGSDSIGDAGNVTGAVFP